MNDENSNSQNSQENKKRSWYWEDKPVSPFVGNASMMPSLMVCNGCELERCKVQQRCEKGNHTDERTALRTEHTAQKAERSSEYG